MLVFGVLCSRPKPWLLTSLSLAHAHIHNSRLSAATASTRIFRSVLGGGGGGDGGGGDQIKRQHSTSCRLVCSNDRNAAASIWHVILPAGDGGDLRRRSSSVFYHQNNNHHNDTRGEGSWNVAWDARPARWLHNLDSAWWLFGVCACLAAAPLPSLLDSGAAADDVNSGNSQGPVDENVDVFDSQPQDVIHSDADNQNTAKFKVTAVPADGRCLFRAIAHMACLRKGEEIPDENRQRELADELRAQVVDELLRRREEAEWYIEGDFDAYIERIEKPYVWGGEPELLMASHVIKTPISVYMIDRNSGSIINIANYGEEYIKDKTRPVNVLFHGYGHYDILDVISEDYREVDA